MCHSPIMRLCAKIACIITSLAAINVGLNPFGYDFFMSEFYMNNMMRWGNLVHYIIGIAGVLSLVHMVMKIMHKGCACGDKMGNCDCK